ncbi:hypothetical protein AUR64_01935 [Haloprofundus marisrubri]|uniref:Uncharacterized protein n=1 Tax=Haloprofundus marisrubri TaxID=1514971 RepID=A0A0W1R3A2_9EURY|nr:hypothetical protein [Haloprofundus marisrubri]KTG07813.1 hypothetical protein AUR64_01935 [Haloprofundus marisrubri]
MRLSGLLSTLTGNRSTDDETSGQGGCSDDSGTSEITERLVGRLPLDNTETTVARESVRLMLERGTLPVTVGAETTTEHGETNDGSLRLSIDSFPIEGMSWNSYYLSTASVGVAFLLGNLLGVPYIRSLNALLPIFVVFSLLVCGALYQLHTRTNLVLFGLVKDTE